MCLQFDHESSFSIQTWISSDSFAPAAGNLRYGRLTFAPRRSSTRRLFQGHYTIGAARGARGSSGFPDGYNREPLRSDLRRADHTLLSEFWQLLKAEGEALGFPFTSAQINKNFAPGWSARRDHRNKDVSFQWCTSLGDFEGGELRWLEGGDSFSVPTRGVWTKIDGRHTHWVEPYSGERYSIVLFCCEGAPRPIFCHFANVGAKPVIRAWKRPSPVRK